MKIQNALLLFILVVWLCPEPAKAVNSANLILNPGAEIGAPAIDWHAVTTIPDWTVISGSPSIIGYAVSAYTTPDATGGNAYFANGPYGNSAISQTVDVSSASAQIDTGTNTYALSSWLSGYLGYSGNAVVTALFEDTTGATLATAQLSGVTAAARNNADIFIAKSASGTIPVGVRKVVVTVNFTNDPTTYNTSFADNLSLVLSTPVTVGTLTPPLSAVPAFDHVFIIMMENTTYENLIGSQYALFINSLANQGVLLTNFTGTYHPSDENYLAIAGGDAFVSGATYYPNIHVAAPHLGDTIEAVGKTWKTYMQGIGTPGNLTNTYDPDYFADDSPFINFNSMQGDTNAVRRQTHMVDTWQMTNDLKSASTTPNFSWIAADDYYDGELSGNGSPNSLEVQDLWLKQIIVPITNSPAWQNGRSLLILTWDESSNQGAISNNNHIATILIGSQGLVKSGVRIGTSMNHYNIGRTIESALGLPYFTANDQYAQPINDAFPASAAPSISVSSPIVITNGNITVTVTNSPGNAEDWVGLYSSGSVPSGSTPSISWQYLNGSHYPPATGVTNATLNFKMPANSGQYQFCLLANNDYPVIAQSSIITVSPPTPSALKVTPQNGQSFTFQSSGIDNQTYIVETSTNLTTWVPVSTNIQSGGWFNFTDTNMIAPARFYRVRQ